MKFSKVIWLVSVVMLILQACGPQKILTTVTPTANQAEPATQPPPVGEATMAEPATAAPVQIDTPSGEFFKPITVRSALGFQGSWLELYFTDPANALSAREVGGVGDIVASSISSAKESVDVALKDLRLDRVTNALLTALRRGVVVRVVTDTDSLNGRSTFQSLIDAGIQVVDDQQSGQMNNRFIVIDHNQVWTGSLNFTPAGVFRENNSLVHIYSDQIAENYTREFDEMFTNNQFGPLVVPQTPHQSVDLQGTQVETLFSPDDLVATRLQQLIGEAQQSVYFLAYTFGSQDLGDALRAKAAEGVQVAGVVEFNQDNPDQTNSYQLEQMNAFKQAGVDVRRDGGDQTMNHKVMIIDGKIVVIGSYDFTERAETNNDENVLIIHNEQIAQKYMEEFQRIQALSQP